MSRVVTGNNYMISEDLYMCEGREWHIRPHAQNYDQGVIHENWIGDPYRLAATVTDGSVIDIGGNIGSFAVRAVAEGAARVLSYEPEPSNIEMFKLNCATEIANGTVVLDERAVWCFTDKTVHLAPTYSHASVEEGGSVSARTIDLNDVLRQVPEPIALLKVDIEGSEIEIFSTCDANILRRVQRLAMEFHGMRPGWGEMVRNLLRVFDLEVSGQPDPYRGGMIYGKRHA